ncbi:MAG: CCA tRNA nucleotidyltransferase [Cyanobacterium sp. T60_A2020_053]|nr:CCA tRNA nucleotidyltransferase [Cyanobacterium sp. T60_A2020_053]
MKNLEIIDFLRSILPIDLSVIPETAYVVGGAVRDAFLQRHRDTIDLDFVLPRDAIKTAQLIATLYHGGFVVLDQKRQIARVVLANVTLDFAQQEGDTIYHDLQRRDYRLNAIAANLHGKELIDPLDGEKDILNGVIRMVSPENLKDDPLRLFRAYRQASQLNFTIDSDTRKTIQELAPSLSHVAMERVKTELDYLLASDNYIQYLSLANQDEILSFCLPNLTAQSLQELSHIDDFITLLAQKYSYFSSKHSTNNDFCQLNITNYILIKLAFLVSSDEKKVKEELVNLKCSNQEIKVVNTIIKYLPDIFKFDINITIREQYFFFVNTGNILPLLMVVAGVKGADFPVIELLLNRYFNPDDLIAHSRPLISGHDLINHLNMKPSPLIKTILTEVEIAYLEGKFNDRQGALDYANSLIRGY